MPPYLFRPEVLALIDQAQTIEHAHLYELLFTTGARIFEALKLSKASLCLERDPFHIIIPTLKRRGRKGRVDDRLIKITPEYAARLRQWLASLKQRQEARIFPIQARAVQCWLVKERRNMILASTSRRTLYAILARCTWPCPAMMQTIYKNILATPKYPIP